ncbi:N-acetylmuramoyl-L-alanine amidase [Rhodopseudomonas palustris]|uniref:N-acetylmuramoyl-L-alanine amidase AmiA n=1 Tax=Rhodopseudomonas palustris TaxID=1076 RepID=A0A323UHP8_RHOPL|nr:N-acetylmuramoyl-L-alanine amidase [Rhodopseudomonas palustris]PZA11849.1 N-acetylmuramoyl-L-alanine amidase [Rhodopseudomonas palustris]
MARRANHFVLFSALVACAAALFCLTPAAVVAATAEPAASAAVPVAASFPTVSDARVAGDDKQTRLIVDFDQKVPLRAFALADPYRVVIDLPQINFRLPKGAGEDGRGLIKAFRYGLVMPGGSRIVLDLTGPVKIAKTEMLDPANGQPARLVIDLETIDRDAFVQALRTADSVAELRPTVAGAEATAGVPRGAPTPKVERDDPRPVVVLDPGHGGIDNGTQSADGVAEKTIVLDFALALRDRLVRQGKFRVVLTRDDDTFIPLNDRVKIAREQSAALFVSIHADALPRREGDAQGATIYTLSDKASDAEAQRLADAENKADAIGGVNLTEEPTDVADILIDLAQRETKTFSSRFAQQLMKDMKTATRMHKRPLKSAGFRVLKAPDVPSVLIELGYVSNKADLQHLLSEQWRNKTVGAVAQAIDSFLSRRLVSAGQPG